MHLHLLTINSCGILQSEESVENCETPSQNILFLAPPMFVSHFEIMPKSRHLYMH